MSLRTRRQFLEDSMFAAAAAVAANSAGSVFAAEEKQSTSPNERLSVAVVGVNGRGVSHLDAFTSRKDTEVTCIVDVDDAVGQLKAEYVAKRQNGRAPKVVRDMRQAFDDKSIDLVSTATPNHWHSLTAIWAMQAGKDMYVEKPVSHNVSEGRRVVETARHYNKICQTGTQSRSMTGMQAAMKFLHEGKIGEIRLARGLCYKRRGSIGPKGHYTPPSNVDYDLWLGPAPLAELTRKNFHYDWHWQWPYGNGDLGNQGIHQMDLARWGMGLTGLSKRIFSYGGRLGYEDAGETANTQVVVHDYGDKSLVFEVRGLPTQPFRLKGMQDDKLDNASVGVIFTGTSGYLVMASYEAGAAFDKDGKMLETFKGGGDHFANFVAAVRSRKHTDLNADILEGHYSSALCHLGNISYRLGKQVSAADAKEQIKHVETTDDALDTLDRVMEHLTANKVDMKKSMLQLGQQLNFDPAKETFIDNSTADAMLTREYRAPYVVPAAGKV